MTRPERILDALRRRGDLQETVPGAIGLRGPTLALFRSIEARIHDVAREETGDEWLTPPALSFDTLTRADYFRSFPQWLTAASHLCDSDEALEGVATSADPGAAARDALAPAEAALPPAVCYHTYAALEGRTLEAPLTMTAQATCWRHEGARTAPLERGWAFTMREIVRLGAPDDVEAFRRRAMDRVVVLAGDLGLAPGLVEANDPFFAPTARGRALLQRVKALKHELTLPIGGGRSIAAASFNHHERFFGEAFGIRLATGDAAASGCVAFGLERWLLAVLVAHGPEPAGWPSLDRPSPDRSSPDRSSPDRPSPDRSSPDRPRLAAREAR